MLLAPQLHGTEEHSLPACLLESITEEEAEADRVTIQVGRYLRLLQARQIDVEKLCTKNASILSSVLRLQDRVNTFIFYFREMKLKFFVVPPPHTILKIN